MGDGEWREREVDGHNFPLSCPRGGAYSCGFCIFEVPLGLGDGEGREREVDGYNFPFSCARR